MKSMIYVVFLAFFVLGIPSPSVLAQTIPFDPNHLLTNDQMTNTEAMSRESVKELLARGSLARYETLDVSGTKKTATDIIMDTARAFDLNPQVLLVLLQKEQSLVEDDRPSQDQLDWAMGYAICDDCRKDDPALQKFRGFGNQVHFAAKRLRESFLTDLQTVGKTISGIGTGIATTIDGVHLVPANHATASLYTYTPHLAGNKNFFTIWQRWFAQNHPDGSLLRDVSSREIWFIQSQKKRKITSHAVLASRFNEDSIIDVTREHLNTYTEGPEILFPNYTLVRTKKGTVYLLVDDTRRGFVSRDAFRHAGFLEEEIVDVDAEDIVSYVEGEPITAETIYAQGALLQNNKTGGVYFVHDDQKFPLLSREILSVRFSHERITPVNPQTLESFRTMEPLRFPDGTLVGAVGSPEIFVIENGERRPIADASTFLSFGWKWDHIQWTNERTVLLHPLGGIVSTTLTHTESPLKTASTSL